MFARSTSLTSTQQAKRRTTLQGRKKLLGMDKKARRKFQRVNPTLFNQWRESVPGETGEEYQQFLEELNFSATPSKPTAQKPDTGYMDTLKDMALNFVWYVDPDKTVVFEPFGTTSHSFHLSDSPDARERSVTPAGVCHLPSPVRRPLAPSGRRTHAP